MTKNTNDAIQGVLGKYYARVEYKGTIGIKELAAHMHQHNTAFSRACWATWSTASSTSCWTDTP